MRHFLSTEDLTAGDLTDILTLADSFSQVLTRDIPKVPALRGKTLVLAFFEDSTRTRTSFDLAARRLSADVVNFSASSSSTKKGESLRDTIQTIDAMGVDGIVLRHGSSGTPAQIVPWTSAAVVNAGDGWHAHPSQALLDCYTISKAREQVGSDPLRFNGMRIGICGDINHSRVARSNIDAFTKLGAEVVLIGPQTLIPSNLDGWPVQVADSLDEVIGDLDALYLLRIQNERLEGSLLPSNREYRLRFGLTAERLSSVKPDALIMHPGPMNRGVELDPEAADDPRATVTNQVASGVPIRMAILYRCLGLGKFSEVDSLRKADQL